MDHVTWWACNASDGTADDPCVSGLTAVADTCTDSGTASGYGSCSATDWDCTGDPGLLDSSSSSGVDTCGDTSAAAQDRYFIALEQRRPQLAVSFIIPGRKRANHLV